MPDWDSYLKGDLSIFCENREEAEKLYRMSKEVGIPTTTIWMKSGYRVKSRSYAAVSGFSDPSWQVRHGYTKYWVLFRDFINDGANVQFDEDEFLALLSGGEA